MKPSASSDPHADTRVERFGSPLQGAKRGVILLHGRGSSPEDILLIARELPTGDTHYLAPEAAGETWYPQSFMAPQPANQPWLGSALNKVKALLEHLREGGLPPDRVALIGFSQGGCLALEYCTRNPARYGFIAGLSAGLIGETIQQDSYRGSLQGTPVFLGCSDRDPHVPLDRVQQTGIVLDRLGAEVDVRLYPGMGHSINQDELQVIHELLLNLG